MIRISPFPTAYVAPSPFTAPTAPARRRGPTPRPALPKPVVAQGDGASGPRDIEARLRAELAAISRDLDTRAARLACDAGTPASAPVPAPGRVLFMGHGNYDPDELHRLGKPLELAVPEGTSLTVYAPHGAAIEEDVVRRVHERSAAEDLFTTTYRPGDVVPNYTITYNPSFEEFAEPDPYECEHRLSAADHQRLREACDDRVVLPTGDRFLGDLLRPGMGDCHWLTCLVQDDHPNAEVVALPSGLFDMTNGDRIDPRALPGYVRPQEPDRR